MKVIFFAIVSIGIYYTFTPVISVRTSLKATDIFVIEKIHFIPFVEFSSKHLQKSSFAHSPHHPPFTSVVSWPVGSCPQNVHTDFQQCWLSASLTSAVPISSCVCVCVCNHVIISITLFQRTPPGSTLMRETEKRQQLMTLAYIRHKCILTFLLLGSVQSFYEWKCMIFILIIITYQQQPSQY